MASLTKDLGARALALSVSASSPRSRTSTLVKRLRAALPRRTALPPVGGEIAAGPAGVQVFTDLRSLTD